MREQVNPIFGLWAHSVFSSLQPLKCKCVYYKGFDL